MNRDQQLPRRQRLRDRHRNDRTAGPHVLDRHDDRPPGRARHRRRDNRDRAPRLRQHLISHTAETRPPTPTHIRAHDQQLSRRRGRDQGHARTRGHQVRRDLHPREGLPHPVPRRPQPQLKSVLGGPLSPNPHQTEHPSTRRREQRQAHTPVAGPASRPLQCRLRPRRPVDPDHHKPRAGLLCHLPAPNHPTGGKPRPQSRSPNFGPPLHNAHDRPPPPHDCRRWAPPEGQMRVSTHPNPLRIPEGARTGMAASSTAQLPANPTLEPGTVSNGPAPTAPRPTHSPPPPARGAVGADRGWGR